MATTKKKVTICATNDDIQKLEELVKHFEDTKSSILKRAIALLHYKTFNEGA